MHHTEPSQNSLRQSITVPEHFSGIGIGSTEQLTLRVSAACLTLFLVQRPESDVPFVLLERVTKVREDGTTASKLQPIGGGIQINDSAELLKITGGFNFDTEKSLLDGDLRIFIAPEGWGGLRARLTQELQSTQSSLIETSPLREIQEEVGEYIRLEIHASDIECIRIGCALQKEAVQSQRVPGSATVRIFAIDQVSLLNRELENQVIHACDTVTIEEQRERALSSPERKSSSLALIPLPDVIKSVTQAVTEDSEEPESLRGQPLADNVESIVRHLL